MRTKVDGVYIGVILFMETNIHVWGVRGAIWQMRLWDSCLGVQDSVLLNPGPLQVNSRGIQRDTAHLLRVPQGFRVWSCGSTYCHAWWVALLWFRVQGLGFRV